MKHPLRNSLTALSGPLLRCLPLAPTLLFLVLTSCVSYKLNGSALDYDRYKTIRVSEFPIRANDIDQTFSAYRDFSSDLMLTDVQDDLCQQISEELVDLIFNATLGNW